MQIALFGGSLTGPRPGSGMGDEREMDYGDDRMVRLTVLWSSGRWRAKRAVTSASFRAMRSASSRRGTSPSGPTMSIVAAVIPAHKASGCDAEKSVRSMACGGGRSSLRSRQRMRWAVAVMDAVGLVRLSADSVGSGDHAAGLLRAPHLATETAAFWFLIRWAGRRRQQGRTGRAWPGCTRQCSSSSTPTTRPANRSGDVGGLPPGEHGLRGGK
jgi:hypothetical protein